jgi:hypothetical protein
MGVWGQHPAANHPSPEDYAMNFKLDALFDATDKPYLDDNALGVITQYISSVPDRLKIYGLIRDNEVSIMQPIADALQQMPNQSDVLVERSTRNGLMVMRYMAMAMVLDDTNYLEERLEGWLPDIVKVYDTKVLDQQFFHMLPQQLAQVLSPAQQAMVKPYLDKAQSLVLNNQSPALAGVL